MILHSGLKQISFNEGFLTKLMSGFLTLALVKTSELMMNFIF